MELASIIEHYQTSLRARYGGQLLPVQQQALNAIVHCRTERYGEMILNCEDCKQEQHYFHSCGHWTGCPGAAKHREVRERPSQLSALSKP